jgi:DNA (cytosine-5)-methyltransferase 1
MARHLTLRDAISGLPPLDAREGKNSRVDFHPMHWVSVMSDEKYWWIANTPSGSTAYNNQCVNTSCGHGGTPGHQEMLIDGRWRASKNIPLHCVKCGSLLPRPSMLDKRSGQRRAISGFHSSYRRMEWDKPARALTSNFPFEASDNKVHPDQNRTLSIYEAMVLQTIADYHYEWVDAGSPSSRSLIAHVIGESVPPKLIDFIVRKIVGITSGQLACLKTREPATLFDL